MSKIIVKSKLSLNKATIASLNNLNLIKGGGITRTEVKCLNETAFGCPSPTDFSCQMGTTCGSDWLPHCGG